MRNQKRFTIFIVESNKMYSFMLMYKLQRNPNLEIISYSRAGQCIQYLDSKPDIIVLDYKLLGAEASEVMQIIKERSPKTAVITLFERYEKSNITELRTYDDYVIKENDSTSMADNLIRKMMNVIEKKKNETIVFKQKIFLFGVSLIIIIIAMMLTIL